MDLHAIYRPVETELLKVEESLAAIAQSSDPAIAEVISDVLGAGGKRLRPALLLIAARACNYSGDRAVRLAVAVGAGTSAPTGRAAPLTRRASARSGERSQ